VRRNIDPADIVEVRIRLGTGLARLAPAPMLTLALPDGATVNDLFVRLGTNNPELAPALRSALPVIQGSHVERGRALSRGDEVALLTPLSGG
jgi:molybdopterin converting factor small subunit